MPIATEIRTRSNFSEIRKLWTEPEAVYANSSRQLRYAVMTGREPDRSNIRVQSFDKVDGKWRVGSFSATFSDNPFSRNTIAFMAGNENLTLIPQESK